MVYSHSSAKVRYGLFVIATGLQKMVQIDEDWAKRPVSSAFFFFFFVANQD